LHPITAEPFPVFRGRSSGFACSKEFRLAISKKPASSSEPSVFGGVRKLVRPQLADHRRDPLHNEDPLSHAMLSDRHGVPESSHAEVFYFQKQIQQQTEMTVVLEDGEELHGIIQWFDKCAIKIRVGRQRIMVYKSSIKYLYKGADAVPAPSIMK
jgi:RNA chaperone Hfq